MTSSDPGPAGLNLARLREYLDRAVPGLVTGELRAELIAGGRSNLTYRLRDDSHGWVLRRPPLGHVLPTAHDMAREYRVIGALGGTSVPVPATVLLCEDADVIGAPFYLMEHVEGAVHRRTEDIAGLTVTQGWGLSTSFVDVLAELHAVDPAAVGLGDFGRPDGYLERQVRRWTRQLDASRSREIPGIDDLATSLGSSVPRTRRTGLVHGDYKIDNVVVGARGQIAAVLDWEMSTLGDPLADLGLLLVYWERGQRYPDPRAMLMSAGPGFLSAGEVLDRYAARSAVPVVDIGWYVALGCYKLAVISEGIHYRYTLGLTVGEGFERSGAVVESLVDRAREILDAQEPEFG